MFWLEHGCMILMLIVLSRSGLEWTTWQYWVVTFLCAVSSGVAVKRDRAKQGERYFGLWTEGKKDE